jgi:hypothetical protein
MCTLKNPCGGLLQPDRYLNDLERQDLETAGAPVFVRCLNGHRFPDRPVATLPAATPRTSATGQCLVHQVPRPCLQCVAHMNRARVLVPRIPICRCGCGQEVPPGRKKYASNACARAKSGFGRGRPSPSREDLLRQRELVRAGFYE